MKRIWWLHGEERKRVSQGKMFEYAYIRLWRGCVMSVV